MPGYELIGSEELAEIQDVFAHGGVLFRHGFDALRNDCYKVRQFEQEFAAKMGIKHALAVTSGTAALRVALAALDIGPGDEVITQSFTFVATAEAIIESRATPICAEIDTTLNMDPDDLLRKITPRTKAVIVVHMLGTPARLPEIAEICRRKNLVLIEDTAWGCGGNLQGKPLGTWGDVGTFSFDFAKTMTTGEGGMVVFRDEDVWKKAAAWHDHGHENNPAVPRWEDTRASSGFNYRMMELQGAVGIAQLKKLSGVVEAQRRNRDSLWQAISDLPGIQPRSVPHGAYDTADALVFLAPDNSAALRCREELLATGLATKILPEAYTWHFAGTWKHMPELVAAHGGNLDTAFPQSHAILSRAVSLPVGVKLAEDVPSRARRAIEKAMKS
jgi:8-amino-3,8-dideoxy-alpha-D-manno-octulosonate transaminase